MELLIVIVVIGILAAITVVAYNGIQERALNTTIRSDAANFKKKIELARVDSADGLYPVALTSSMGLSFTKSAYDTGRYNVYYCVSADRSQFAYGAVSKRGWGYIMSSQGDSVENAGVTGSIVCGYVGLTSGAINGYTYANSVGVWQPWTN